MAIHRALISGLLCLLLAGCGQATTPSAVGTTESTPGMTAAAPTAPSSTGPSTSATGTAAPASAVPTPKLPTVTPPDYTGAQPLPASDDKPMLWPLSIAVHVDAYSSDPVALYGFLDVHGKLVLPQRYSSYLYCPDASGRVAFLIAQEAGARAEVYDLTGRLLRRAPTPDVSCAGPGQIVFTHWIERELNQHSDGLLDLATGRVVVALAKNRHIDAVDDHTVNVSDPSGEYFLDLTTKQRTPHAGYLVEGNTLEKDAPGIPARLKRGGGLIGFVSRSGSWVLKPRYEDTYGFSEGIALVQVGDDSYTFLDASLREVGGTWAEVDVVSRSDAMGWTTTGYHVSRGLEEALLDPHLKPIVPTGGTTIDCGSRADGSCSVKPAGSTTSLVVPPSVTLTPLPSGYEAVLSSTFAADAAGQDTTRVLALASGASADLGGRTSCRAAGTAWVVCEPPTETMAPLVLDQQGRRTTFATAEAVLDPVRGAPAAYFEVTGAGYRGIVDATGAWRYRMSLYTRLED